jgi:hypothetical protein
MTPAERAMAAALSARLAQGTALAADNRGRGALNARLFIRRLATDHDTDLPISSSRYLAQLAEKNGIPIARPRAPPARPFDTDIETD